MLNKNELDLTHMLNYRIDNAGGFKFQFGESDHVP